MKENVFKENFKRTKNLYNVLKKDEESTLFASERLNKQFLKKIKRSKYEKYIIFSKLYNQAENVNLEEKEDIVPVFMPFVENQRNIDRSTLIVLMVLFNSCMQTLPTYVFFQNRLPTHIIVFCLLTYLHKKFTHIL